MGLFSKFSSASKPVYLVCGLGNPEAKYDNTRHNAGFMAVDYIAQKRGLKINKLKGYSLCGECEIDDAKVIFIKPQTYMNNSGKAVQYFTSFYKIPVENVVVISDDVNLNEGVLRIRANGSEGGHNGLKSISEFLNSKDYPRMRIGVGIKPDEYDLVDWVLGKLTPDDIDKIQAAANKVNNALDYIVKGDVVTAMSKFNG